MILHWERTQPRLIDSSVNLNLRKRNSVFADGSFLEVLRTRRVYFGRYMKVDAHCEGTSSPSHTNPASCLPQVCNVAYFLSFLSALELELRLLSLGGVLLAMSPLGSEPASGSCPQ